jgi:hypothetical protein
VTTNINQSVLNLGQEVLHDVLQTLLFDLVGMHRLYPIMEEDIEFQKGLSVKQNFGELLRNCD